MKIYDITGTGANVTGSFSGSFSGDGSNITGISSDSIIFSFTPISSSGQIASDISGSFLLNSTDTLTGDLTVTGQVIAQTLNVQQVTSSIVYSSGSNVFGNDVSNTQQFTGSINLSGSFIVGDPTNGLGRIYFDRDSNKTRIESAKNGTDSVGLSFYTQASGGGFAERVVIDGNGATTFSSRVTANGVRTPYLDYVSSGVETFFIGKDSYNVFDGNQLGIGTFTALPIEFATNNVKRLTISSTGEATFSSTSGVGLTIRGDWDRSATNNSQIYIQGSSNTNKQLRIGYDTTGNVGYIQALTSGTSVDNLLINPSGGSVGIGTTSPGAVRLKVSQNASAEWVAGFINTGTNPYGLYVDTSANTGSAYSFATYTNAGTGFFILNDGKVGIGNTNPLSKLHIGGALENSGDAPNAFIIKQTSTNETTGIYLERSGERKGYYIYVGGSVDSLNFQRNNSGTKADTMTLTRDGYIGIGTTSPATKLEVSGGAAMTGGWNKNTTLSATYPVLLFNSNSSKWAGIGYDYSAAMRIWVNGSSNDVSGTGTNAFTINNNGNVGIGTTNPAHTFHVDMTKGSANVLFQNGSNDEEIFYGKSLANADCGVFRWRSSGLSIHSYGQNYGTQLFIDADTSNVGIGTTNPTQKLEIGNGNIRITELGTSSFDISYSGGKVQFGTDSAGTQGYYFRTYYGGYADRFIINSNGNVDIRGTVKPLIDATYDLGSPSLRWNNLYTTDLHLSNEGKQNDIDGTWGDWTLQEGENNIYMLNNRSGEKFKIMLEKIIE